ncbi:hypothetical protein Pelo_1494 [Pelomyxa schiedti]|nr:hypothetical protein Pelo_1494 [Pelomyxa schiedti]
MLEAQPQQQPQIIYYAQDPSQIPAGAIIVPNTQMFAQMPQQNQQPLIMVQPGMNPMAQVQVAPMQQMAPLTAMPAMPTPDGKPIEPGYLGIVPQDFARHCDTVFDGLPKLGGRPELARLDSARAVWAQYGDEAFFLDEVERMVFSKCSGSMWSHCSMMGEQQCCAANMASRTWTGCNEKGLSRASFALGCYLLAARKPGAPAAPQTATVGDYIESGYSDSHLLRTLVQNDVHRNNFAVKLVVLLLLNTVVSVLTLCWWMFGILAIFTLLFSILIFSFNNRLPFLLANEDWNNSILAFGLLGFVCNIAMFGFMIPMEETWVWGMTWVGWEAFQVVYLVLSIIAIVKMRNAVLNLCTSTVIPLPKLGVPYHNSKAMFISGWIVQAIVTIPCIAMCFYTISDGCAGWVTAICIWSMMIPGGLVGIVMFSILISRRYSKKASICGLLTSIMVALASVWLALPVAFTARCYWMGAN